MELDGNVNTSPSQMEAIGENVGAVGVMTFTVMVAGSAHCPSSGVKVYVVVLALSMAGLQFPVILLIDVVGRLKETPVQISDC
jgi:hypothetical protein